LKSIAFSKAKYRYLHFHEDNVAEFAIRTVKDFFSYDNNIEKVTFVCVDDENYDVYHKLLNEKCVIARAPI